MSNAFNVSLQNQTPCQIADDQTTLNQVHFAYQPDLSLQDYQQAQKERLTDWLIKPVFNQPQTKILNLTDPHHPQTINFDQLQDVLCYNLRNPDLDANAMQQLNTIYTKALQYSNNNAHHEFVNLLLYQRMLMNHVPLPSSTILYTFDVDVLPLCKQLCTQTQWDEATLQQLLIGFGGVLLPQHMTNYSNFIIVRNPQVYRDLINSLKPYITPQTQNDYQELQKDLTTHDIFNTWICPASEEALSFKRITQWALSEAIQQHPNDYCILPCDVHQLVNHQIFTFIDLDQLSQLNNHEFNQQLHHLKHVLQTLNPLYMSKLKHIAKAQKVTRMQHDASFDYSKAHQKQIQQLQAIKIGHVRPLNQKALAHKIIQILKQFKCNQMSENVYQTSRRSFMRANRRHPDSIDYPGTIHMNAYRPNIHVYLDTSGSISESMYRSNIYLLIQLAKALKTNFFFSSFSDTVAQPLKLELKGKTVAQIYQTIQDCPKLTGGTEYENVWRMIDELQIINRQHGLAPNLNFMITDFAYDLRYNFVPNLRKASTNMTYYIPINDPSHYSEIVDYATDFANSLITRGDYHIKQRLLM